jgi:hypothetical protein
MSVSGAYINRTKCVLVVESSAGTDDGSVASIEAKLRSGGRLSMSVNMCDERLILSYTLYRTLSNMPHVGRQWTKMYNSFSTAESVRKFLSQALILQDVQMQHTGCKVTKDVVSGRRITEATYLVNVS